MNHPSEETLLGMVEATLPDELREELEQHLDRCPSCRAVVAELARDEGLVHTQMAAGAHQPPSTDGFDPGLRYSLRRRLGQGGMGEVFAAFDRTLHREVALKRIKPTLHGHVASDLFLREAQLAAQLEHPNILPVHDIVMEPGEPFFTMKLVRGSTLQHLLDGLAAGDAELLEAHGPLRLGIIFLQLVQALTHAHSRGVLHADLKPSNVLVGTHGEVLVTDWGLARVLPGASVAVSAGLHVTTGGTAQFMSPEQARGEVLTEASDVYALGAVLYSMLTLTPPHQGTSREAVLAQLEGGALTPPRVRAPTRPISDELEQVCLRAMAHHPSARFESAAALGRAMEAVLSGARRRRDAQTQHEEGATAHRLYRGLEDKVRALEHARASLAATVPPSALEPEKEPLWRLEEAIDDTRSEAEQALALALDRYGHAASIDPSFVEPAEALATLHLGLFLEAERHGDRLETLLHRRQVERFHRGVYDEVLQGKGTVRFEVDEAVEVEAYRLVEAGKRLVRGQTLRLEQLPREPLELPRGSYVFELTHATRRPVVLNVFIERGSAQTIPVRLFDAADSSEGFVHVPAGPFVFGGDRTALNSAPRQTLTLPDFFIARFPVTCAEYADFLNALDPTEARQHVPRTKPDGGFLWERTQGRYVVPEVDADGNPGVPSAPVMGVSFDDARRYAAWRSERAGRRLRLPTEQEWEKAARGADGRFFPWGNGFDPSFCKMALSRPGRPLPEPVGTFVRDCSVYGMQDAAGAIREWCESWFDEARTTRVLRGGAWYFNPHYCRLAFRHGYLPHIVFTNFGIRLAHDASG